MDAARVIGASDLGIILRHVLPNVVTPAIVFSMTDVVLNILLGSSLSFLGLGAATHAGVGLDDRGGADVSGDGLVDSALPGVAIMITGMAFSLIGGRLADVLRLGG